MARAGGSLRLSASLHFPPMDALAACSEPTDGGRGGSESTRLSWWLDRPALPRHVPCLCPAVSPGNSPFATLRARPSAVHPTPGSCLRPRLHQPAELTLTSWVAVDHLSVTFQRLLRQHLLGLGLVEADRGADPDRPRVGARDGPLTRSSPCSASILTTSRLRTVTRSSPMCPAMRLPLARPPPKPRLEQSEPIEPGERCLRSVPCEANMPLKWWRFITPWKPLPLLVPITSTYICLQVRHRQHLAQRVVGQLVGLDAELAVVRLGSVPALASWPIIGIVELRGLMSPKPICTARSRPSPWCGSA
jgi:hypothetical protein